MSTMQGEAGFFEDLDKIIEATKDRPGYEDIHEAASKLREDVASGKKTYTEGILVAFSLLSEYASRDSKSKG